MAPIAAPMKQLSDTELFPSIQTDDCYSFPEVINRYSEIFFRFIQRRVCCDSILSKKLTQMAGIDQQIIQ
ncbi:MULTISPECIES: hypothetical protein [Sphingobacterium]|uniref:hypothetical protein n=1 Tax=Sphingobacterium TaxID=28453 RepID=UPI00257CAD3F|nr:MULTISPECIES: hypothetical protein [Sphingobacterium]